MESVDDLYYTSAYFSFSDSMLLLKSKYGILVIYQALRLGNEEDNF